MTGRRRSTPSCTTGCGAENAALGALSREQKRRLVSDLYHQGAFKAKSAADYIANVLSMGRATVYKHLRELKQE